MEKENEKILESKEGGVRRAKGVGVKRGGEGGRGECRILEEINSLQAMAGGNNISGEIKMEEDYMRVERHGDGDGYNSEKVREGREKKKKGWRKIR